MRRNKAPAGAILSGLIIALIAVALWVIALAWRGTQMPEAQPTETDGVTAQLTESATGETHTVPTVEETTAEETTEPITEAITEAPTEPRQFGVEDQPALLTALLEQQATTYEELAQSGCAQLVAVISEGTAARIRFYSCEDGLWQELSHLAARGYVGYSGANAAKREGDGCTPTGLYGIGTAFYIHNAPDTGLEMFQITDKTYWVDDPDSRFYNQRVEGLENKDWNSAEQMIRYDAYRYGFVVDYNVTGEYRAGSAIFFHIGDHPTAGCIATDEEMVLAYLAELDQAENPRILIVRADSLEDDAA